MPTEVFTIHQTRSWRVSVLVYLHDRAHDSTIHAQGCSIRRRGEWAAHKRHHRSNFLWLGEAFQQGRWSSPLTAPPGEMGDDAYKNVLSRSV
jgi:hypothetical protein